MNQDVFLLIPDLDDISEDDSAEPDHAEVDHKVPESSLGGDE